MSPKASLQTTIADAHSVVLFHDDADGFASALSAYFALPAHGVAFVAVNYHYPSTKELYEGDMLAGKNVFILDFSAPGDKDTALVLLAALREKTKTLLVIDHHPVCEPLAHLPYVRYTRGVAGCILSWDFFAAYASPENESRDYRAFDAGLHPLISRIGAYDVWAHRAQGVDPQFAAECEAVNLALDSDGLLEEDQWDRWAALIHNKHGEYNELLETGAALVGFRDKLVRDICRKKFVQMRELRPGVKVPVVFSNVFPNEVASQLLADDPTALFVGVAYHFQQDGVPMIKCSLRSEPHRIDVGKIAEALGGGGRHETASFTVKADQFPT